MLVLHHSQTWGCIPDESRMCYQHTDRVKHREYSFCVFFIPLNVLHVLVFVFVDCFFRSCHLTFKIISTEVYVCLWVSACIWELLNARLQRTETYLLFKIIIICMNVNESFLTWRILLLRVVHLLRVLRFCACCQCISIPSCQTGNKEVQY